MGAVSPRASYAPHRSGSRATSSCPFHPHWPALWQTAPPAIHARGQHCHTHRCLTQGSHVEQVGVPPVAQHSDDLVPPLLPAAGVLHGVQHQRRALQGALGLSSWVGGEPVVREHRVGGAMEEVVAEQVHLDAGHLQAPSEGHPKEQEAPAVADSTCKVVSLAEWPPAGHAVIHAAAVPQAEEVDLSPATCRAADDTHSCCAPGRRGDPVAGHLQGSWMFLDTVLSSRECVLNATGVVAWTS